MEAKACDDPVPSAASRAFGRSLLSNIHVFKDLSPDDLTEVEQACRYRRCCPQEQIIDRDGTTADVFFVVRGRVRVVNYSMSGREISFADLGEGDHFGELAVLDSQPRSASVVAVEDSLILALSGRVFVETLVRHPRVALRTMARLARMVRAANDRIMDLSTLAAQNRVHAEIVHQARRCTINGNTARIAPVPLHSDIASRVSITRETVARVLNDLARQGLVERTKDTLLIHDVAHLQSLVQEVRG